MTSLKKILALLETVPGQAFGNTWKKMKNEQKMRKKFDEISFKILKICVISKIIQSF